MATGTGSGHVTHVSRAVFPATTAPTLAGSTTNLTPEEAAYEAVQNFENVHKNYIAIINPNTGRAMLHLKKYGECTLIDPRACIHHYECAADVACILYAPVSVRYFHYMVYSGYLSDKSRVVLNDTKHDTYVFVIVENLNTKQSGEGNSVEAIIRGVQRQEGTCRAGTDVLQVGTPDQVGYYFHQPKSFRRVKSRTINAITQKVMTGKDWAKRVKNEKAQHDCQRRIFNENRKQEITTGYRTGLRSGGCAGGGNALDDASVVFHVPTLMIQSSEFEILPPTRT